MSPRSLRPLLIPILFSMAVISAAGQVSGEQFRALLATCGGFSAEDLRTLDTGGTVVKLLPRKDKQEIAVLGIARMGDIPTVSMADLRDSLKQNSSSSTPSQGGKFSEPPVTEDLRSLELDKEDIEDLQKCRPGDCNLNLSSEMIKKLQREVDWSSPGHEAHATEIFRQMLLELVNKYLQGGTRALGKYDNRYKAVDAAKEHDLILKNLDCVLEWSPDLEEFLRSYPNSTLAGVDNDIYWSVVDFGMDPLIAITHNAAFQRMEGDSTQLVLATRQIYSTRYVDASLALTMLMRLNENGVPIIYLVFANRSRSDAFDGLFSNVKRSLVETEALAKAKDLLEHTQMRLIAASTARAAPAPSRSPDGFIDSVRYSRITLAVIAGLVMAVIAGSIYFLRSRKN